MNFCSNCAASLIQHIPENDNRLRYVCMSCHRIFYDNPKIVVGTLPVYIAPSGEIQVLLCKRAIEPRLGFWTLPAGFMENDETTSEGALRETQEEAQAQVSKLQLFTVFSVPHVNQVHIFYKAHLPQSIFGATPESLEVELFSEQAIPWEHIAFRTVKETLQLFFSEVRTKGLNHREVYTVDCLPL